MATIKDVARRAQVSIATVSHVLNGTRPVSEEVRRRVVDAAQALNYHPDGRARSLRRKRTQSLGLVIPDNANPFFAALARAIEDASFARGYSVILGNADGNPRKERLYLDVFTEQRVDGVILATVASTRHNALLLLKRGTPCVVMDRANPDLPVDTVQVDNRLGARLAVEHLISLGHRRIACIGGPANLVTGTERVAGFREALRRAGLDVEGALLVNGDFSFESGYRAARQLLDQRAPPTAIFAANDLMALGVIRACSDLGARVPDDVAVAGFDDVPLASMIQPRLTTVAQPLTEMARIAIELLLARLGGGERSPEHHVLAPRLVVRESSGPSRDAGGSTDPGTDPAPIGDQ